MKKSKDMLKNVKRLGYFIGTMAFFIFAAPVCSQSFEIKRVSERNFVHFGVNDERSTRNLGDNANIGFINWAIISVNAIARSIAATKLVKVAKPMVFISSVAGDLDDLKFIQKEDTTNAKPQKSSH